MSASRRGPLVALLLLVAGGWCAAQGVVAVPPDALAGVRIDTPHPGARVNSPLLVTGAARGPWFFEASFTVRLVTPEGVELAVGSARAQGDWMTEAFVPFVAELHFSAPATDAVLTLERANPSGLPENAASIVLPVTLLSDEK